MPTPRDFVKQDSTLTLQQPPLTDRLRIHTGALVIHEYDGGSQCIPVGRLCNEAADEIERLRTLLYIARHDVADTLTRLERSTHASYPEIEYQRDFLARINSALAAKEE
jgi:hypothetical protein